MDKYISTIGLEIHAELKTRTKMFCDCKNDPDEERPNVNICPVCLGHPGTLPVINQEAVGRVLKVGAALGGHFATMTEFDRKNYFYPDIPKGYQISQYKYPLVSGGELSGVKITRVHLEEDTGTSIHSSSFAKATADKEGEYSLVNFNRAGVPLMELVTEPVIHFATEAVKFAKELQLLLRYLGVGEANMEKGEMRIEANVSVKGAPKGDPWPVSVGQRSPLGALGTKVEIKNLNSFKAAEKAIEYEIKRQSDLLEGGKKVAQETRGWDEGRGETFSQRQKEESHDYRYFSDPDLPRIDISKITEFDRENILAALPQIPQNKRENLSRQFGIKESDIEFYINNISFLNFAEQVFRSGDSAFNQLASNYIVSDLASREEDFKKISPANFTQLIEMINIGKISSRGAKDILEIMLGSPKPPEAIALEKNLMQKSDEREIEKIAETIISQNQKTVLEYKKGKFSVLQFLVGQGIKLSKGNANPHVLKGLLEKKITESL